MRNYVTGISIFNDGNGLNSNGTTQSEILDIFRLSEGIKPDENAIEVREVRSAEVSVNTVSDEVVYSDEEGADDDSDDEGNTKNFITL